MAKKKSKIQKLKKSIKKNPKTTKKTTTKKVIAKKPLETKKPIKKVTSVFLALLMAASVSLSSCTNSV